MPIIPTVGRLRQKDHHKFKASLGYIVRCCLKTNQKTPRDGSALSPRQSCLIRIHSVFLFVGGRGSQITLWIWGPLACACLGNAALCHFTNTCRVSPMWLSLLGPSTPERVKGTGIGFTSFPALGPRQREKQPLLRGRKVPSSPRKKTHSCTVLARGPGTLATPLQLMVGKEACNRVRAQSQPQPLRSGRQLGPGVESQSSQPQDFCTFQGRGLNRTMGPRHRSYPPGSLRVLLYYRPQPCCP